MLYILCPLRHVAGQFMCIDDIRYCSKLCHCLLYVDDAHLLLSEVDRFCASWKETPIHSFNIFCAPKMHYALLKIGFFWGGGLLLLLKSSLNKCFTWKMASEDRGGFSSPS